MPFWHGESGRPIGSAAPRRVRTEIRDLTVRAAHALCTSTTRSTRRGGEPRPYLAEQGEAPAPADDRRSSSTFRDDDGDGGSHPHRSAHRARAVGEAIERRCLDAFDLPVETCGATTAS